MGEEQGRRTNRLLREQEIILRDVRKLGTRRILPRDDEQEEEDEIITTAFDLPRWKVESRALVLSVRACLALDRIGGGNTGLKRSSLRFQQITIPPRTQTLME